MHAGVSFLEKEDEIIEKAVAKFLDESIGERKSDQARI